MNKNTTICLLLIVLCLLVSYAILQTTTAEAERAAGERAIDEAIAGAINAGNKALEADRRAAHGEPLWPYVLTALAAVWLWRNEHKAQSGTRGVSQLRKNGEL